MARLQDKVVLLTGGSGGIGLAVAKHFLEEGAKVFLVDINEDNLKRDVASLNSDDVGYAVADVSDPDDTAKYVNAAVEKFGGIDVYIANAGIEGSVKPLTEYPLDMFDKVLAVNVRGVLLGLQYTMPKIAERGGGSIIITSSVAGKVGSPGMAAYVTSKHAIIGLMRTAALEGAQMGIRVNTVNPAPVETRMMRSLEEGMAPGGAEQAKEQITQSIPLGRYGEPAEVAQLMLFLASDESKYITGSTYMIDGGATAN